MQPPDRFTELQFLLATPEPPDLGPGPRAGVKTLPTLNPLIAHALHSCALSSIRCDLVRALILLWHDHLDDAHTIAQQIENADGSYVHGILHRREPDYSNARYWFHRVGKHPAFAALADRTITLLASKDQAALLRQLVPRGHWEASAFIDACEEASSSSYVLGMRTALPLPVRNERGEGGGEGHPTADTPARLQARGPSSPQPSPPSEGGEGEVSGAHVQLLRSIQAAEFHVLLRHFCGGAPLS
jgi:hypothetical protein